MLVICMGMIQTRPNVPLSLTSQQLLLQAQLRLGSTMQHIYSHGQNVASECAMLLPSEHLVSPRNRKVTLVGSTFLLSLLPDSMLVVTWTNFTCFTRREKDAHACPTASVQKLVQCFCLVSLRIPVSLLVRAARCCCVFGSVGAYVLPSLSPFTVEGLG